MGGNLMFNKRYKRNWAAVVGPRPGVARNTPWSGCGCRTAIGDVLPPAGVGLVPVEGVMPVDGPVGLRHARLGRVTRPENCSGRRRRRRRPGASSHYPRCRGLDVPKSIPRDTLLDANSCSGMTLPSSPGWESPASSWPRIPGLSVIGPEKRQDQHDHGLLVGREGDVVAVGVGGLVGSGSSLAGLDGFDEAVEQVFGVAGHRFHEARRPQDGRPGVRAGRTWSRQPPAELPGRR